jgi:hypothetical protein
MKIAVIDSGVATPHSHIGKIAGGVTITPDGESPVYADRVGHGTAVMAAIMEKAPAVTNVVEFYAVRVFDRGLRTKIEILIRGIEWAMAQGADLINLSLGTTNEDHAGAFEALIGRGALLISPASAIPGSLAGVIGVECDFDCPREHYYARDGKFYASGFARPIPGVPPEKNLNGASFAVANLTGFAARACVGLKMIDYETVRERLESAAK